MSQPRFKIYCLVDDAGLAYLGGPLPLFEAETETDAAKTATSYEHPDKVIVLDTSNGERYVAWKDSGGPFLEPLGPEHQFRYVSLD